MPCYALLCALGQKLLLDRHPSHVGFADAWAVLLQAHNAAVQELTFQLSASISVTTRQKAELSNKKVKRLYGKLSEQQAKMMQLQSLVSEKEFEFQKLSAEKLSVVEGKQAVSGKLGTA